MTFAKISVQEIQMLYKNKASALEIIVYQTISSHIHSTQRINAFPSLSRIQTLIGSDITIQSISRAISSLVKKGLLEKGERRSINRFQLIHRPVKKAVNRISKAAKTFVSRFTPSSLSSLFYDPKVKREYNLTSTKQDRKEETKLNRKDKRIHQVEKSKCMYEERGEKLWEKIAPNGKNPNLFNTEKISDFEKVEFRKWLMKQDTEQKTWITEYYKNQLETLFTEMKLNCSQL